VSRVKRYLEEQTETVLDSVRLYGSAVLSERRPGQYPYQLLQQTLQILERDWLTGASSESRQRLADTELALAEAEYRSTDLDWDWREALEDCVEEAVEGVEQWLSPYGLRLSWETVGLCAVPEEEGQ
jgi:hypothetical protein